MGVEMIFIYLHFLFFDIKIYSKMLAKKKSIIYNNFIKKENVILRG